MKSPLAASIALLLCGAAMPVATHAQKVYHVAVTGSDHNDGSSSRPLRTISAAAALAQPGDTITVSAGIYRERVSPPRGGTSDTQRIVYQAAPGETVEIRGSEVIKHWVRMQGDLWRVVIPNSFFGNFNPYKEVIHGDWFFGSGHDHRGEVYLDGHALLEAGHLEDMFVAHGDSTFWYGVADSERTTIWAQFRGADPNRALVEITTRPQVFYPEKTGINYITVRGFTLKQAATQWAPPTAEQMGLIGTHWSKGWIIENNTISDSRNVCVALGKYGDEWDNKEGSAEGYVETIHHAIANGWSAATIGHHIVRNNVIYNCGQAGVVGSLGAIFSTITGNVIHDVNIHQAYSGAEVAGIKIHGAIDVVIAHNHIYKAAMGVWLDWMAQGTRVEDNLMHDNVDQDLMVEVDHGPFIVDNNIFLSKYAIFDISQGGAFVHNLIGGAIHDEDGGRETPYFKPHTAELVGLAWVHGGDMRYYNNIFGLGSSLRIYDHQVSPFIGLPITVAGNVFLTPIDTVNYMRSQTWPSPPLKLVDQKDGWYLQVGAPVGGTEPEGARQVVTTALLGFARIPEQAFENRDGSPVTIDFDYFGKKRPASDPVAGPFADYKYQEFSVKVWPQ